MATTNDELKQMILRVESKIDSVISIEAIKEDIAGLKKEVSELKSVVQVKPQP